MKRLLVLTVALMAASCASGPEITTSLPPPEKIFACPFPYPQTKSRFIHAIEVRRGTQATTAVIGVTLVDPASRSISCALMSAEGMELFEATASPSGLEIGRALPPLDKEGFARNMIDDIEMIFLAPQSVSVQKGTLADGAQVCRYRTDDGLLDTVRAGDGVIRLMKYTKNGTLRRSVTLASGMSDPYGAIELHAPGVFQYSLIMTLIEAGRPGDESLPQDQDAGRRQ
jgi:hypothetical protein